MNTEINIVAIKVVDRIKISTRLQKILSLHSSIIKTRFGYHELSESKCSRSGLIILELNGSVFDCQKLIDDLKEIGGIIVEVMTFNNK
jgi:hypothetical protein